MTEYLKMVPLPSWWQKLELKDLAISDLFVELLSLNSKLKQTIHLDPIFATRKAVAPFSNIQSCWADQYGSIDTSNIKICLLVIISWQNILG